MSPGKWISEQEHRSHVYALTEHFTGNNPTGQGFMLMSLVYVMVLAVSLIVWECAPAYIEWVKQDWQSAQRRAHQKQQKGIKANHE